MVGEPGMALTMHLVGMFPIHAGITEVGLDSCVVPVATMWGGSLILHVPTDHLLSDSYRSLCWA